MNDIIIFLGPSLPLAKAKQILPQALYLPPVKFGDVIAAMRLQPKVIGIVDGNFETVAAVRHKEILYALSQGIAVYGAASMGALRAAELSQQGMIGIGQVFQQYQQGILIDDDEVALLHGDASSEYLHVSEPMVAIRATLLAAQQQGVLNERESQALIKLAKQCHYHHRQWPLLLEKAELINDSCANLQQWLKSGNRVDPKAEDAILLLQTINDSSSVVQKPTTAMQADAATYFNTVYFRAMQVYTQCRPFPYYDEKLPLNEQIVQAARIWGDDYLAAKRLAYVMAACTPDLLKEDKNAELSTKFDYPLAKLLFTVVDDEFTSAAGDENYHSIAEHYAKDFPYRYRANVVSAMLWASLSCAWQDKGFAPSQQAVQRYMQQFRMNKKLRTPEELQGWLTARCLSLEDFSWVMQELACFEYVITQHNYDVLGEFSLHDGRLLEVALKRCGLFEVVERAWGAREVLKKQFDWFEAKYGRDNINLLRRFDLGDYEVFLSFFSKETLIK